MLLWEPTPTYVLLSDHSPHSLPHSAQITSMGSSTSCGALLDALAAASCTPWGSPNSLGILMQTGPMITSTTNQSLDLPSCTLGEPCPGPPSNKVQLQLLQCMQST